jgi:hypothetical protein
MLKLTLAMLLEAFLGLIVAAVVLAIAVPLMMNRGLVTPGDRAGSVLIASVMASAILGMLFRPGSALSRSRRKDAD